MFRLSVRIRLTLLWLVVAALFAVGLVYHWPFLVREHRRIEPWKGVLIWSSDVLAVVGFLWFGFAHLIRGKPYPRGDAGRFDRLHWAVILCFAAGLLADGAVSWWAWMEEDLALKRARVVWGEIIDAEGEEGTGYFAVVCRFADDDGVDRLSLFPLATVGNREASERIRRRQFGVPIRMSFDPRWPDRNWLTGCGHERGERLDELSLITFLLQVLCLPFVVFGRGVWRTSEGDVPVYKLLPMLATVFIFTLTIVAFWRMGRTGF